MNIMVNIRADFAIRADFVPALQNDFNFMRQAIANIGAPHGNRTRVSAAKEQQIRVGCSNWDDWKAILAEEALLACGRTGCA